MDFSATTSRGGGNSPFKLYISNHAIGLLREFSGRTGIPMSRVVDNLVRDHVSRELPADVVLKIVGELPAKTRKRTTKPVREKEFKLD